jgi:NADPH:quinone reductase
MANALKFLKVGSAEVLEWRSEALPKPTADQIQITQLAIGVNYIDIYHRTGLYPLPLPSGVGVEGVGIVEAVGENVKNFSLGDRVVYVGGPPGGYASARNVPAGRALKLPEDISTEIAASLIFKGLTVEYLIRRCHVVKKGDTVLFHAAAGGIGLIAGQWLKHIGASTIGTVGSEQKAELARANGYDHTIIYTKENFTEKVREITNGQGVSAVYDSIGKDTFAGSLDCLRPRGILISFGTASGNVAPLDIAQLGAKGSLFVTRPSIAHYTADRAELESAAAVLFDAIRSGYVRAIETKTYPLQEAAQAHRDLEARKTTGSLVLVP